MRTRVREPDHNPSPRRGIPHSSQVSAFNLSWLGKRAGRAAPRIRCCSWVSWRQIAANSAIMHLNCALLADEQRNSPLARTSQTDREGALGPVPGLCAPSRTSTCSVDHPRLSSLHDARGVKGLVRTVGLAQACVTSSLHESELCVKGVPMDRTQFTAGQSRGRRHARARRALVCNPGTRIRNGAEFF
jgi:hypothetical protein